MQPRDLIDVFIGPLEAGGIEYMITGSIAATFYGEPRLTHDIDLVLCIQNADIDKFLGMYPDTDFYRPPREVLRVELSRGSFAHFNLIHHETGYKADMYPLSNEQLHVWGFGNRRRVQVKNDLRLWLAPPEYVIVRKLQYFKEGGSQKHLSDIKKMVDSPDASIDIACIEKWVEFKNVKAEWLLAKKYGER
jgi:hypothetical protein